MDGLELKSIAVESPRQLPAPMLGPNGSALFDFFRAAAANMVLFGHAGDLFGHPLPWPSGILGVSIFFLLSGFLILQSGLGRLQRGGLQFTPFLLDRFARIFTAYVPALIFVAAMNAAIDLGHWGLQGNSTGPLAFLGNLFLLQDYPLFQAVSHVVHGAPYIRPYNAAEQFWTIPIEFWLYVVFALVMFGLVGRERIGRLEVVVLLAVALPVVVWNAAAGGGNGLTLVWVVGAAAGYLWCMHWQATARKRRIGALVGCVAMVCLLGRGLKYGWNFQDPGMAMCEVLVLLGLLSIVEGCAPFPARLRRVCAGLAGYSYSLYLVHNTVLIAAQHMLPRGAGWTGEVAAIAAGHAMGIVLYLLFERHTRRVGAWLKARWRQPDQATTRTGGVVY